MPFFTVKQGKRYKATINLGLVQSLASNEAVAEKFEQAGFTQVTVAGSGRTRSGEGVWPHPDASAEIPPEIVSVDEIEA